MLRAKRRAQQRARQTDLHLLVEARVRHMHVAREAPAEARHRHQRLVAAQLVVLVAQRRQLELARSQRADVPRDVVAPALRSRGGVREGVRGRVMGWVT